MKLYLLISSIFLFSPIYTIHCQVNTPVVEKESKVSIGLVQSINGCFRYTSTNSDLIWMKEKLDSIEMPLVTYSTALKFNFRLGKRFQLNTGVSYSNIGYQYKDGSLVGFLNYKETYRLIEVPVQLSIKFSTKKSYPYITLGVSPAYILSGKADYRLTTLKDWYSMDLNQDYTKLQTNASFAFGGSFNLTNSWDLKTELFYNQFLLSLSNGPLEKRLFSTGLSIGLFKRF